YGSDGVPREPRPDGKGRRGSPRGIGGAREVGGRHHLILPRDPRNESRQDSAMKPSYKTSAASRRRPSSFLAESSPAATPQSRGLGRGNPDLANPILKVEQHATEIPVGKWVVVSHDIPGQPDLLELHLHPGLILADVVLQILPARDHDLDEVSKVDVEDGMCPALAMPAVFTLRDHTLSRLVLNLAGNLQGPPVRAVFRAKAGHHEAPK